MIIPTTKLYQVAYTEQVISDPGVLPVETAGRIVREAGRRGAFACRLRLLLDCPFEPSQCRAGAPKLLR